MTKLLREPLLHFLLIGAALFVVFGMVDNNPQGASDNKIVVSAGRIEQLNNIFAKTWRRPASADELKGLIDDYVLEEIYYRQAVAMGIDRDDTVIRRRLRQKFEFLTGDLTAPADPSDDDLARYLTSNPEKFRRDSVYSFEQVYFAQDNVEDDELIEKALAELRSGSTVEYGSGLVPVYFDAAPARIVDSTFGSGFAMSLDALPLGEWHGPVQSGLGNHLIRIDARHAGEIPELDEIRSLLAREWSNEARIASRIAINDKLLENYDVEIEWPTEAAAKGSVAQ